MELHLPYCFYPKIQEKNNVWGNEKRLGGNHKEAVRDEAGVPN